jgi:transcriptional regulator with XRE-family HTH domain
MSMTLGGRLRSLRDERGWTLAELASRSSVSIPYLSDIEHDRKVPTLGRLQSIAQSLGIDSKTLLTGVRPYDLSAD